MRILFATAQPYLPEIVGGMQKSTDILMTKLLGMGHDCFLLTALVGRGWLGLRARLEKKITKAPVIYDAYNSYNIGRAWFPWENVDEVAKKFKPDVIVIPCGNPVRMALAAQKTGVPVIMWLQNVEFTDHGGEFTDLGDIPCVANSQFTADKYHTAYGVSSVIIHPMMDIRDYQTPTTREHVTFINPHADKGLETALQIAEKCPDIPFTFVKAWTLSEDQLAALHARLKELPNVSLHEPVSDMRNIYKTTKLLLVPSKFEEAYGRVATEAQFSGIPVIATAHGGLPESVGDGGILINPDADIQLWVDAVRKLWADDNAYQTASQAATAYSRRPALNVENQAKLWADYLNKIVPSVEKFEDSRTQSIQRA